MDRTKPAAAAQPKDARVADPNLRLSDLAELLPFRCKSDFDRWAGALQAAGLPD